MCWVQALALTSQMKKIMLVFTIGETRITQKKTFGDQFKMECNWEPKVVSKTKRVS